jgi:predicted transcriptional regulator
MDMKPILLPRAEIEARKARELKRRGYSAAEIAAAMGLRQDRVSELLRAAAGKKPADEARAAS